MALSVTSACWSSKALFVCSRLLLPDLVNYQCTAFTVGKTGPGDSKSSETAGSEKEASGGLTEKEKDQVEKLKKLLSQNPDQTLKKKEK